MKKIIILMLACAVSTSAICMKRAADPQWKDEFDKYEKQQRETGNSNIKIGKIEGEIRQPKKSNPQFLPHFRYNKYGKTEVYVRLAITENDTQDANHQVNAKNLYYSVNPNLLNITEPTEYPVHNFIVTILPLQNKAKEYFEKEKQKFEKSPIIYTTNNDSDEIINNLIENKTLKSNDSVNAKVFYREGSNMMSSDYGGVDHGLRGFGTREQYDHITANNRSMHRSIQERQITGKLKNIKFLNKK